MPNLESFAIKFIKVSPQVISLLKCFGPNIVGGELLDSDCSSADSELIINKISKL